MATVLEQEEFARHLNTKFRIHVNDAETIEAELTSVSPLLVSDRQQRFSITFRTSNETLLEQGLRHFEHDQMGRFDLFIVPMERSDEGTYYEAIFNRLIKK